MEYYPDEYLDTEYPVHKSRNDNTVLFKKRIRDFDKSKYKYFYDEQVFGVYADEKGDIVIELRNGYIFKDI